MTSAPWWLEHAVNALDECETTEQALDADNDRYIRAHVLNVLITVTSARSRQSEYRDQKFAQVGFVKIDGSHGQFSIGGKAAWLPLRLQRFEKLPATLILRTETTRRGQLYRWEYALCGYGSTDKMSR